MIIGINNRLPEHYWHPFYGGLLPRKRENPCLLQFPAAPSTDAAVQWPTLEPSLVDPCMSGPSEPSGPGVAADRVSTGVAGMDAVLDGGLIPGRSTLVRGPPGAGKTLFGLHFLAAGIAAGETVLYINLGEPERYLREDARAFGFDTDAIHFLDLRPRETALSEEAFYDIFPAAEVEGPPLAEEITGTIDDLAPDRVFLDPMTQLRYLIDDRYQFRKQVMALLRYFEDTTVVFSSQATQATPDDDLEFLADAVVTLDRTDEYRTATVSKFRGSDFRAGGHSLRITDGGMVVSPSLDPDAHGRSFATERRSSGVQELDALLHGGLETGTVTLFTGPTGVGKTTTALQFAAAAAAEGTRSVLYSFEEARHTLRKRADAIGLSVNRLVDEGALDLEFVDHGALTVDEFDARVRGEVESNDAALVVVDAVDGYRQSLVDVDGVEPLVALGRYLRNMGVTAIFANEVHRVTGEFHATEEGISPLADTIVFFRHIEYRGELRKVIGVLKKRTGAYEPTLRELEVTDAGLSVGEPLPELRGILTGTPDWADDGRSDAPGR